IQQTLYRPPGGSEGHPLWDTGAIMEQVEVQITVANTQELLRRMTEKTAKI
uniref:Uncharacterized protein n=1 Tax=Leptobrachium leishanense TaxID=445787 RepID=A0A8C5M1U3_9ANUR